MNVEEIIYYVGFIIAILLCRGLGRIFWIPMLADLLFDIALSKGLLSGWDIRPVMVAYGLGIFIWVLALAGSLKKSTLAAVLVLDLSLVSLEILPKLTHVGSGQLFWNHMSEGINVIWSLSIFVIIASIFFQSTVIAKWHGKYVDILTNPKKRFLLPIGIWAGVILMGAQFENVLPQWFIESQYQIAALALVWGWVALELPFFLMYRRIKRRYAD